MGDQTRLLSSSGGWEVDWILISWRWSQQDVGVREEVRMLAGYPGDGLDNTGMMEMTWEELVWGGKGGVCSVGVSVRMIFRVLSLARNESVLTCPCAFAQAGIFV